MASRSMLAFRRLPASPGSTSSPMACALTGLSTVSGSPMAPTGPSASTGPLASSPYLAGHVLLTVKDQQGFLQYNIKPHKPLRRLFSRFCSVRGLEASRVQFSMDGCTCISPDDTAAQLALRNDDIIEVFSNSRPILVETASREQVTNLTSMSVASAPT